MDSFGDRRISIVFIILLCIGYFFYYDQTIKSESLAIERNSSRKLPEKNKVPSIEELRKLPEIRVKVIYGCSNKLQDLKAWVIISDYLKKPLLVEWDTIHGHDAKRCLGTFEDVYTSIPNVTIVDKIEGEIHYRGFNFPETTLTNLEKTDPTGELKFDRKLLCEYFYPTPDFQHEVDTFVRNHRVDKAHALHIRKGDFAKGVGNRGQWDDDKVEVRLNQLKDENKKVFLLTDEKEVQDMAKQILKSNLIIYKPLERQIEAKDSDRPTSFKDAMIEIYIASHARTFENTWGSTFSDQVMRLRKCENKDSLFNVLLNNIF